MQLFRNLFLIKLCRIRIWITINLIENYRRIICKTRLPKYFRFTHICANILCGCNLDHTMQLFRNLFLIKLCRIRIWITINLIENYRRIICKTRLPKYFRFTHICANILCGCNDTGINMTSQVTHKIMHRFVFTHALTHPSGPWVAPISQCTVHHA